ncbi:MAG TPA: hypothetical protein VEC35_01050 [Noviherbaspirillum sp.]|nr:hypothetical protein [Noviherbaspirillum sp.]
MSLTAEQKRAALKGVDILDPEQVFDAVAAALSHLTQKLVGEVQAMPGAEGFTTAVFVADEVPAGTKLYTHSIASGMDAEVLAWPPELTPDLEEVLGWPNFRCGPVAHLFQAAGYDIKKKAESEQAFVLHWLASLVLKHGENWRDKASEKLRELQDQVAALSKKGDGK